MDILGVFPLNATAGRWKADSLIDVLNNPVPAEMQLLSGFRSSLDLERGQCSESPLGGKVPGFGAISSLSTLFFHIFFLKFPP